MGHVENIVDHKIDIQKMSDKWNEKEKIFLNLLIEKLKSWEYVTATIMADITDIPTFMVRRYMNKLYKLKVIEAKGANKGKKYYLQLNFGK